VILVSGLIPAYNDIDKNRVAVRDAGVKGMLNEGATLKHERETGEV